MNKANILAKTVYNSKKIIVNGNNLRPKLVSKEKHKPLKLADVSEAARIKDGITERAGVSLRESFNAELNLNPVWKTIEKQKWQANEGMSRKGYLSNHVNKLRETGLGGTGKQNAAIMTAQ